MCGSFIKRTRSSQYNLAIVVGRGTSDFLLLMKLTDQLVASGHTTFDLSSASALKSAAIIGSDSALSTISSFIFAARRVVIVLSAWQIGVLCVMIVFA